MPKNGISSHPGLVHLNYAGSQPRPAHVLPISDSRVRLSAISRSTAPEKEHGNARGSKEGRVSSASWHPRNGASTALLWKPGSPHAADGHTVCCWQMTRLRMAGLPPTHHTTRHKASWARDLWCAVASGARSFASLALATRRRTSTHCAHTPGGGHRVASIFPPSITALSGDCWPRMPNLGLSSPFWGSGANGRRLALLLSRSHPSPS